MSQSLILSHSWPIYEAAERIPLSVRPDDAAPIGMWTCLLETGELIWSPPVYALFSLPEDERLTRSLAVSLYLPESRRAMEELRAYAIKHCRGFTLDAQIRQPDGARRWMRLTALPVIDGRRVVRLTGTKQDVTAAYDGLCTSSAQCH